MTLGQEKRVGQDERGKKCVENEREKKKGRLLLLGRKGREEGRKEG